MPCALNEARVRPCVRGVYLTYCGYVIVIALYVDAKAWEY